MLTLSEIRCNSLKVGLGLITAVAVIAGVSPTLWAQATAKTAPALLPNTVSTLAGNNQIVQTAPTASPTTFGYSGDSSTGTLVPAFGATLDEPTGIGVDSRGNIYFADGYNGVIREVPSANGTLWSVAGTLPTSTSCTGGAYGAVSTDCSNSTSTTGNVGNTGDGGPAIKAKINVEYSTTLSHIAVDNWGNFYFTGNGYAHNVRMVLSAAPNNPLATYLSSIYKSPTLTPGTIYTVAGPQTGGGYGLGDGPALGNSTNYTGFFHVPQGIAVDYNGILYIADNNNHALRAVNTTTSTITINIGTGVSIQPGYVKTIVGASCIAYSSSTHGGCTATAPGTNQIPAGVDGPQGIYVDVHGNLYFTTNNTVAKGVFVVYAAAPGADTSSANPIKNLIPLLFSGVTATQGYVYQLTGGGTGSTSTAWSTTVSNGGSGAAGLSASAPSGVVTDQAGNIYFTDTGNAIVGRIDVITGQYSYTGKGSVHTGATLTTPLYCSGTSGPQTTSPTGDGCYTTNVQFQTPIDIAMDSSGNLYIADNKNNALRKISTGSNFPTVTAGTGTPVTQMLRLHFYPSNLPNNTTGTGVFSVVSPGGDFTLSGTPSCAVNSSDTSYDCLVSVTFNPLGAGKRSGQLVALDASGVSHSYTLTGTGAGPQIAFDSSTGTSLGTSLVKPVAVATDAAGNTYVADAGQNSVIEIAAGTSTQTSLGTGLKSPQAVATDPTGDLYIADTGNNRIVEIQAATGNQITLPAPYGSSYLAPQGVALDPFGNLFIADTGNQRIVTLPTNGWDEPVVLSTGALSLQAPSALATDSNGNLYVSDTTLKQVLFFPLAGQDFETLFYGTVPEPSVFNSSAKAPAGIAVDGAGTVYLADNGSNSVLAVPQGATSAATVISSGLNSPGGLTLDPAGNLYVADTGNTRILFSSRNALTLNYGTIGIGLSGAAQTYSTVNAGTAALNFTNLSVANYFAQQPSGGSDCTASTVLAAGGRCQVAVNFTPTAPGTVNGTVTYTDNNLNTTSAIQSVNLTGIGLTRSAQTITFPSVSAVTYGAAPIVLGATSSSGLAVTYSVVSGPGVVSGNQVAITGAGTIVVQAAQTGSNTYLPATSVTTSITVNPALLTVTANNYQRGTGVPNPTLGYTITGFVYSDTAATSVTGQPAVSTTAVPTSPEGTYPITITQGTLAASNYTFNFVNGTLIIKGVGQIITFNPLPTVVYGVAPISLTATSSSNLAVSFAVLSGPGTISGTTLTVTGAGTIVIQATQAGNSSFVAAVPVSQSLTVTQAPLTVTANNTSRSYGAANPTFTSTLVGVVNGDVLTASYTTTATISSTVGTYPIVPSLSGANLASYIVTPVNGTLTVTQAAATTTTTSNVGTISLNGSITLMATVASTTSGQPTGTVTFSANGTSVGTGTITPSGLAVLKTTSLPGGKVCVTGTYSGDTNFATSTSACLNVVVQIPTSVTLVSSAPNSNLNSSITFTAIVTATANLGVPTGTVNFFNGATLLGSGTLDSLGYATFSTSALTAGTYTAITAAYVSDGVYLSATSATLSQTVTAPAFTLCAFNYTTCPLSSTAPTPAPMSATIQQGQSAQVQLTVAPVGGFNTTITFTCTGLPANATCQTAPSPYTPDGSNTNGTITVTVFTNVIPQSTSARNTQHRNPLSPLREYALAALAGGALLLGFLRRRLRNVRKTMLRGRVFLLLFAAGALCGLASMTGCSNANLNSADVTPVGTNIITITASAANYASQSLTYTLNVQP